MNPVLISEKKLPGRSTQLTIFMVIFVIFVLMNEYFSLSNYIPAEMMYPELVVHVIAFLISVLFSALLFKSILNNQTKKMDLIVFSVNLAADNSYHYLRAPGNMLTSDFFKYFFIYLMKNFDNEKYKKILEEYFLRLEIRRSDEVIKVLGRFTLFEGGLKDGDICQVIGKSKKEV